MPAVPERGGRHFCVRELESGESGGDYSVMRMLRPRPDIHAPLAELKMA
jgi:hypothetical protein